MGSISLVAINSLSRTSGTVRPSVCLGNDTDGRSEARPDPNRTEPGVTVRTNERTKSANENACREHHPSHRRRREHPARWYQKGFRQEAGGQGACRRARNDSTDGDGCGRGNRERVEDRGSTVGRRSRSVCDACAPDVRRDAVHGETLDVVRGRREGSTGEATRPDPTRSMDRRIERSPDRAL